MSRSRVERAACVALPELPLQLLLRRRPAWRGHPVALVDDDSPNAPLVHVNREARAQGLRPGIRHGSARSLVRTLRTGVVAAAEVTALTQELVGALQTFSPRVELESRFDGVFHIDPNGLSGIYGGHAAWARAVHCYLRARDFRASVVVGFHRHRTAIMARSTAGPHVLASAADEVKRSNECCLRDLDLGEALCDPLAMLGIETLGAFLGLRVGELQTRFGSEAAIFHSLFSEGAQLPMQPLRFEQPRRVTAQIEPPQRNLERLLFEIGPHLDSLLDDLRGRGERLTALEMTFGLEPYGLGTKLAAAARTYTERLEPASPTDDRRALLDLVRLRLARMKLASGVERLELEAFATPVMGTQLDTPDARPTRDREAASRALARIRASYGDRSVTRARLRNAHLPEAQFRFEPVVRLPKASPVAQPVAQSQSVAQSVAQSPVAQSPIAQSGAEPSSLHRRLLSLEDSPKSPKTPRLASLAGSPVTLPRIGTRPRERRPPRLQRRVFRTPQAVGSDQHGAPALGSPVRQLRGPQRISGGWWGPTHADGSALATERDYYYAEVEDGTIYWVYFDQRRQRWFVQGRVD